ncbi:PKD domain-containing protein [Patescibacteria group bacterium]|nr:PKD domain-containing protein [Patescibacteria group bacterium]
MTKKLFAALILIVVILGNINFCLAQQPSTAANPSIPTDQPALPPENLIIPPKAVIEANKSVEVNKRIIFDASKSFAISVDDKPVEYEWDFGDGNSDTGKEVVHTYDEPGEFNVVLKVRTGYGEGETSFNLVVYKRLILLVSDNNSERELIKALQEYAQKRGVYIRLIESFDSLTELASEDTLIQKLAQSQEELKSADQIIIWTKSSSGLKMISRLPIELNEAKIDFAGKDVVFITEESIRTISRIARSTYKLLKSNKIVLTRKEALYPLVDQENTDLFLLRLKQRAVPFETIDAETAQLSILNFMNFTINYLVEKNIPINTISLILMLPVIVTVIAFAKQVIGLSTLGVYTPSIITLSFLAIDFKFGLVLLLTILATGTIIHHISRRTKLLYIPRMAIILTVISLTIIGVLAIGASLNISRIVSTSVFPLLVMSTLAEKFVSIQGSKGFKSAIYVIFETILVAIIAFIVVGGEVDLLFFTIKWEFIRTLIFGYPELIFVCLIINIILGRWTGLRLSEYLRFKEVLRRAEEE